MTTSSISEGASSDRPYAIAVLAIGMRDGIDMEKSIKEVRPEAVVRIVSEARAADGMRVDEFVMTQEFASQRSIRLLTTVTRCVTKTRPKVQRGL